MIKVQIYIKHGGLPLENGWLMLWESSNDAIDVYLVADSSDYLA